MTTLKHLGIIADGNRRWAKAQGLPSIEGHKKGLETIKELVGAAAKAGIEYLTFYVFSTENWGRSADEVGYIMKLAETRILKYAEELAQNNARLLVLGAKTKISPTLATEIADAAKIAASEGEITPAAIRKHLYHPEVPDIDMVVRTSGEERISGFMLWRSSYAELMFIEKFFPEMGAADIDDILREYESRSRRFGK